MKIADNDPRVALRGQLGLFVKNGHRIAKGTILGPYVSTVSFEQEYVNHIFSLMLALHIPNVCVLMTLRCHHFRYFAHSTLAEELEAERFIYNFSAWNELIEDIGLNKGISLKFDLCC